MASDPNSPQPLASAVNEMEAALIVGVLKDQGIDARAVGGFTSGFQAESPGQVQILVRQVDFERARAVLEEIQEGH